GLYALLKAELCLHRYRYNDLTVPLVFKQRVKQHPNKPLFYFEDKSWTFEEFDVLTNKIANFFINNGFESGDEVALFMDSTPIFVAFWLALAKCGIIPALINNTLKMHSLAHSVNVITAKAIIFDEEMSEAVNDVIPLLNNRDSMQYFCFGESNKPINSRFIQIMQLIERSSNADIDYRGHFTDRLFYIYTSGTSGFPKASNIKHSRYFMMGIISHNVSFLSQDDIIYNCLPLYHSVGGGIGTCQSLVVGLTSVIRKKFSASRFWEDCVKHNCTVALYIGELCRYLLSQPENSLEKQHK
ncbi:Long-chain fatty acid transport protein 1-like protein, partial [Dinothrombium tinctorium]